MKRLSPEASSPKQEEAIAPTAGHFIVGSPCALLRVSHILGEEPVQFPAQFSTIHNV